MRTFSPEDLFIEVCELADQEGAPDQEGWNVVVDEVVQGHLDLGELPEETDSEALKGILRNRFEEYKQEVQDRVAVMDDELAEVGEDNIG
jgi:hypothetical protein